MAEEYPFMGNWFLLFYKALHILSGGNGRKEKSFRDSGDDRLRSYPNNRFQGLKSLRKCLWGCQGKRRDLESICQLEAMRWIDNLYGWSNKKMGWGTNCYYRDKMDPFGRYVWTHLWWVKQQSKSFISKLFFLQKPFKNKRFEAFEGKTVGALQRKNHWLSGSLNRWWVGSLSAGGSNTSQINIKSFQKYQITVWNHLIAKLFYLISSFKNRLAEEQHIAYRRELMPFPPCWYYVTSPLTCWKNMSIRFRLGKPKCFLITTGYQRSYKFVEKTRNVILMVSYTRADRDLLQGRNNTIDDVQLWQRPYLCGILALYSTKGAYAI